MASVKWDKFSRGFSVTEPDGTVTSVSFNQGLDLVLVQKRPGMKDGVEISTYSNPGITPYSIMLKFAIMAKIPFKIPTLEREEISDPELSKDARFTPQLTAAQPFPIDFPAYREGIPVDCRFVIQGKQPMLEMQMKDRLLTFSPALIKTLIESIPVLYKNKCPGIFRMIHAQMERMVRQKKMDEWGKSVIEKREPLKKERQGGFEFPDGNPGDRAFRKRPTTPPRGLRKRRRMGR